MQRSRRHHLTTGLALSLATLAWPISAHAAMMSDHTWKGTVAKVNAMMGTTDSFVLKVGTHHYTVDYTSKVHVMMGMTSGIKAGAKVTVTGTLKGTTISALSLTL
jgi:hypothetical protein